jgi:tetratricopeptide (TPR) repeat protein
MVLKRNSDGKESQNFTAMGEITQTRTRFLANGIFYLWASFKDYFASRMEDPPQFVDEIPSEVLSKSVQSNYNMMLIPTSLAVKSNGNLLAGFSSVCLEMDRNFRILDQPGKQLLDAGNYLYAYGVAVTPGDTIILKPSMGSEMYRLTSGMSRPQRWRTGVEVQGPFAALSDGSVVILDQAKRRATRILGRKRYPMNIHPYSYSYIAAITGGPEETLWVYDAIENRVRIHAISGELIDSIMPIVDQTRPITPTSMAVYANGRFVLFASGEMLCFRRDGTLAWRITEVPGSESDVLPQMAYLAVDSNTGIIYLADLMGKRILKFLDTGYSRKGGVRNDVEEKIIRLNQAHLGGDNEALVSKALLYEEVEAYEMAVAMWDGVLDLDVYNNEAQQKIDQMEISILKRKVAALKEKTLSILQTVGPESARQVYSQTVQLYERILSLRPDDAESKGALDELRRRFLEKTTVPVPRKKPLTIVNLDLENLFPSLMQYYRNNPAGSVRVKNTLAEPAKNLRASLFIKKYMDFPSESEKQETLRPGEEAVLDLKVLFNGQIFSLQEDLPVQARIEVVYEVAGEEQMLSKETTLTIYRRTALSWDDSGKIASFIMPNEGIVSQFAHKVSPTEGIERSYRIAEKFFRAIKICDAVGVYGVNYIEDPESPISGILGRAEVIDTVRFPRTTLLLSSGDCDDTTALLGSLLESVGIRTAVMTSPGHVFLALDTSEPEENLWLFKRGDLEAIRHAGSVWIPIETTILNQGFHAAWLKGSELVKDFQKEGKIEFLPVYRLRNKYPSLPLPESSFKVVEPPGSTLKKQYLTSVEVVTDSIYNNALETLKEKLARAGGDTRRALKVRNQIGVLHARFRRDGEAESVLSQCIQDDPGFLSSYINLGNLRLSLNKLDEASRVVGDGLRRKPESVLLNLLMARISLKNGDNRSALSHYRKVKEISTRLADRYSDLFEGLENNGGTDGRERAGISDEDYGLIWDSGE